MERKTTKFKYLLLIPALFLGMSVFAQKVAPVKQATGKSTAIDAVSNHRPANWQLEQELQGVLDGKKGDATTAQPKPQNKADNPLMFQEYEAKKALHALEWTQDASTDLQAQKQAMMNNLQNIDAPSMNLAPVGHHASTVVSGPEIPNGKFPSDMAYAYNAYDPSAGTVVGPMHFVLNTPGSVTSIANQASLAFLAGASWANGTWYAAEYSASSNSAFVSVNTSTGARTIINASMGVGITGLAYDWTTNTMYGIAYSSTTALYTIDLITGVATLVGNCGAYLGISLGCNQEGNLYMVDIIADNLVQLNKTTGAATVIGPIGFNANYAQDMEFDNSDNTMYYASFNATSFAGELRTVNLTTGATTLVGTFSGGMEVTGFAIQNLPFITYDDDLGIVAITAPNSGTGLTSAEQVTVTIRNYGSVAHSNFPVQYTLDGGSPVIETCNQNINPSQVITFSFSCPGPPNNCANLSAYGNHTIVACTALPGDQNSMNDCKTKVVTKIMPTWTDTIYPQNAAYWTGSTNGTTFTQNSLIKVNAGGVEDGWAKFDISNVPNLTQISAVTLGYYMQSQSGAPYMQFRHLTSDPMTSTPAVVMNQIQTGTQYISTSSGYSVGWHTFALPNQACLDLSAATPQDWFATGFYEYESCVGCYYGTIEGWQQTHRPFLIVTYGYIPGPNDCGVSAINAPGTGGGLTNAEPITLLIKNYGTNNQLDIPVVVTITGPLGTVTLPTYHYTAGLAGGATSPPVTITTPGDFHIFGNYTIHACTNLPGDAFANNDCKTKYVTNNCPAVIYSVTSPVSGAGLTANEPVSINITNIGTVALNTGDFSVQYTINGGAPVVFPFVGTLGPGGNTTFPMGTADLFLFGTYNFTFCPVFTGNTLPNSGCYSVAVVNSVPTVTDTFYPGNAAYWTGSTNGTTFTQNNKIKINAGNVEDGWAKFDITDMPTGVSVNTIHVHFYAETEVGYPYMNLRRMVIDPMTSSSSAVMAAITTGANYGTWTDFGSLGWKDKLLGGTANADLSAQTAVHWFATGFYEYESCVGCYYGQASGWQDGTYRPYMVVNYTPPIAHDVALTAINTAPYIAVGPYTPTVNVHNYGTNTETFTVTMTGPGGYIGTATVTNLPGGQSLSNIAMSPAWNAPLGPATLHACTGLNGDLNFGNNCLDKSFVVEAKLTQAYGYNAYDPSAVLPAGPVKFFLEHPNSITSLAPTASSQFIAGGCWANGIWYGAEYSTTNNSNLWTINPVTGAMTLIGPMGCSVSGMSYDHTTNTMWAVAATQNALGAWVTSVYTVDLTTGATVSHINAGPIGLAINLACSQQGMLLFAEITNDRLWAYDPLTNELELMGPLGINLNYAQDAEFDKATNILYFAGYSSTGTLYTVNLMTGAITSVGTFQGGAEITGFAIPYTWTPGLVDMGAMWITHPTIGNLTNAEPIILRVRNYGQTTVTDMNLTVVTQCLNYTDSWAVWGYPAIDPGVWFDYGFIPVDTCMGTPGLHCVKAWISNVIPATDLNHVNDTVGKCVNNVSCGLITCFPNAIQEPEPCGNEENGGCYASPNAFIDIASGDTYCGNLWKVDTMRDTDWYKFTLGTPKGIAVKLKAEMNVEVYLIQLPCANMSVNTSKIVAKCHLDSLVISALPAGQYAIMFAEDWFDFNTACNNNTKYTFSFEIRPAKYCVANTSYCDEFIANVQVSTTPAFSNPSNCTPGGYKDYTNLTINVNADGTSYGITVTNGLTYYSADQCGIWIDWNNDYDFYETNEKLIVSGSPGVGPYTSSFVVPANAVPGPTRLRTRITYTGAVDPCGTTFYGEVEDYTVYVHAQIPPIITNIGSLTQACPGIKVVPVTVEQFNGVFGFNLVLNLGTGVTYQSYQNVNPELATGTVTVTPVGSNVQMNWFSVIPANIGTGTLMELVLNTTSGTHNLVWDQSVSQYSSLITGVFDDTYNNGTLTFGNCSDLTGRVRYKNAANSVIHDDSVKVRLYQGANIMYSTTPDTITGVYTFSNLANGVYTLKASSTAPKQKLWVGGNATDALIILRHFVGYQPPLTGLNLTVADVNNSGGVPNAVDALAVSRRFVLAIQNFAPAPDWYFTNFTVTIDGTANQVQEIRGLCAGDVNGSGTPIHTFPSAPPKMNPSVDLNTEGTMYIDNAVIDVPVTVQNELSVGAVSLVLNYPKNLDILGVKVANTPENLVYTAKDGQIRIAWFTNEAVDLKAGAVLLTLQVKANSISDEEMTFVSTVESVLADDAAQNYESASLLMPKLVSLNGASNYSLSNYPNPFNSTTEISYSIAKSGNVSIKVYNVLGEEVATVVNASQKAGNYTVTFDGTTLPKGVYVYKLQVNDVTKANSMVITQ